MNPVKRVVLVGFMGSGKSTIGEELAGRLGWSFLDLDSEIEKRAGRSVADIFSQLGEASFRNLENDVGEELLRLEEVVIATGGGWAASSGRIELLDDSSYVVWLKVSAATSVRRAGADRPLLQVPDAEQVANKLLREREPYYRKADVTLDSESASPSALAAQIAIELEKRQGGGLD